MQAGSIELLGGGTLLGTSTTTAATGATLYFNSSYNIASGATLNGPGTFQLLAGTLSVTGNLTAPNFLQTGGLLAGAPVITGGYAWQAGTWSSSGTNSVGSGGILTISTAADHDYNASAIINNGTVNWQAGYLRSGNGGTITNNGIWNDTTVNQQFNNAFGGTTATFTNNGTYARTGTGTTSVLIPFANNSTGTIVVSTGALSFTSFTNTNGSVSFLNGGTASFPGVLDLGTGALSGWGTAATTGGVTAGGVVFPDNLAITGGGLTLQSTAILAIDIGGPVAGTDYSLVTISGSGALNGQLILSFSNGYEAAISGAATFIVFTAGSVLTGSFANVANGSRLVSGDSLGSFQVNYGVSSLFATNSVVLSGFQAVPEPSTWSLLGLGLLLAGLKARRRAA